MITASEARELSASKDIIEGDEIFNSLLLEIEKSAKQGHKGVILKLRIEDCSKLSGLGYDVGWYKDSQFAVSWGIIKPIINEES